MIDQHIRRRCGEQPADRGTAHRARDVASLRLPFGAVVLAALLLVCGFRAAKAQDLGPLQGQVSLFGAAGTGERLPFWLGANTYGTVDRTAANLGTRLAARRPFANDAGFDVAFGADLLARASGTSTAHLHQLYGQLRYGPLQATAGWKRRTIGRVDSALSMGSMMVSPNAPPVPRVSASIPDFLGVPGTRNYLAFQGHFDHGWLAGDRVVADAYLHSKSFYLRILPERLPVQLYGGIVHNVLWAGTHPQFGDLPDDLDAFWKVITAQESLDPEAEPSAEGEALGSGNGMYDVSIDAEVWGVDARAYRQFYIETSAGAQFRSVWDGLWGVRLDWAEGPLPVERVLWEHLYTKRQSAQLGNPDSPSFGRFGTDKYYSNGVYRTGWTVSGRTIGTPLLFADGENPGVDNNIVIAHHVALAGTIAGAGYRVAGTWSRNYGSRRVCAQPDCLGPGGAESRVYEPPRTQWSFLAAVTRTLAPTYGVTLRAAVAYDTGAVYEERVGLRLGLTWQIDSGAR
jgi:hypothetical protein